MKLDLNKMTRKVDEYDDKGYLTYVIYGLCLIGIYFFFKLIFS